MRFSGRSYHEGYFRRKTYGYIRQLLVRFLIVWTIAYFLTCIFLYFRQGYIVYRVNETIAVAAASDRNVNLKYQEISLNSPDSTNSIHGWWFNPASQQQPLVSTPHTPANILSSPKTILYLAYRGKSNVQDHNLTRIKALQQLGFSVLAFDYQNYGSRGGQLPKEAKLYEDSQAAWEYLTEEKHIGPEDIFIYGESLGGAIAIELAVRQPEAAGLIVQSSFTSMIEQIRQLRPGLRIFPLNLIVQQRFNSLQRVRSLKVPVLFIHGTADTIVNYKMSRQLYYAAPEPKTLFYVPGGEHISLDKPGKHSYLLAIKDFVSQQNPQGIGTDDHDQNSLKSRQISGSSI